MQPPTGIRYSHGRPGTTPDPGCVAVQPDYPTELVPALPRHNRMGRKARDCTSRALFAYNGTVRKGAHLTDYAIADAIGGTCVDVDSQPYYAIISYARDRRQTHLVYINDTELEDCPSTCPVEADVYRHKKLICAFHEPGLCDCGHVFVVLPPRAELPDTWCIVDPYRADGVGAVVNEQELRHLLCGVQSVIFK